MTHKKRSAKFVKRDHDISSNAEVMNVLKLLQQKVLSASALNGGFDTLLTKIDAIKESHEQLTTKIDSIYDAVYHPDDGLFARVKDVENIREKIEVLNNVEKDIIQLKLWHESSKEEEDSVESSNKDQLRLNNEHAEKINELVKFKARLTSVTKWLAVTLAGALTTVIGKLVYEFLAGHITIH